MNALAREGKGEDDGAGTLFSMVLIALAQQSARMLAVLSSFQRTYFVSSPGLDDGEESRSCCMSGSWHPQIGSLGW